MFIKICIFTTHLFNSTYFQEPCATLPSPCVNEVETYWQIVEQPEGSLSHTSNTYMFTREGMYIFEQVQYVSSEGQSNTDILRVDTFLVGLPPNLYENEYEICHGDTFGLLPNSTPVNWTAVPPIGWTQMQVSTTNEFCSSTETVDVYAVNCDMGSGLPSKGLGIPAESQDNVPDECNIYMPNAVSPDSNSTNDIYEVNVAGDCFVKELTVFDRWGTVIHETHPWDPFDVQPGTYVVKVVIQTHDNRRLVRYSPVVVIK